MKHLVKIKLKFKLFIYNNTFISYMHGLLESLALNYVYFPLKIYYFKLRRQLT